MAATASSCYPDYDQGVVAPRTTHTHKDYSRPLHVDCSVEYELPNAAKPPAGGRSEPLLMIHPCYYRRAESQRRSPFINNLPAPRRTTTTTAYQSVRYVDPARQAAAAGKRDPLLCSSADSGHWTDTERSPLVAQQGPEQRLPPAGPDSGIATTPVGDDKLNLPGTTTWTGNAPHRLAEQPVNQPPNQAVQPYYLQLLAATCAGEVNNNSSRTSTTTGAARGAGPSAAGAGKESARLCQPAVGVAAVAASCRACHPQGFLQPQQRAAVQQPWPGAAAPAVASGGGRHRGRAVEPGPEHAATSSSQHRRPAGAAGWGRAAKRSRVTTPATAPWPPPACCKACQQWNDDNSRVLWNNDNVLRLFQV